MKRKLTPRARHLSGILENYFIVPELVTQELYGLMGPNAICVFEEEILITLVQLRKHFKTPFIVNNWHLGGRFDGRGYRDYGETTGSNSSLHRLALAIDFMAVDIDAYTIRKEILENSEKFPYLRRLEKDVSWIHFDLKETYQKEIYSFKG